MNAADLSEPRRAPLEIFLVAAEESGDRLGAGLMQALRQNSGVPVHFSGVGGSQMTAAGLETLYPIDDLPIIGLSAIPGQLPNRIRRVFAAVRAVLARRPHMLVIIDSPGFTLWIARFVRRSAPSIPIVEYVSPSVWAWRPGRARSMRRFVDHVLALLPFEPDVHQRLGGPPCSYVGHPLIEQAASLRPDQRENTRRLGDPPVILCFPGSRIGEVQRHSAVFGTALGLVNDRVGPIHLIVPTVPNLAAAVTRATESWPVRPRIVVDHAEKQAAFRIARAALAKSGTVTLELAIAGVPMIAAYRMSGIDAFIARRLVQVPSVILANLTLGDNVVPELLQENCTAPALAAALVSIIGDTPQRRQQTEAFAGLDAIMEIGDRAPAVRAADIILGLLQRAGAATVELPVSGQR